MDKIIVTCPICEKGSIVEVAPVDKQGGWYFFKCSSCKKSFRVETVFKEQDKEPTNEAAN